MMYLGSQLLSSSAKVILTGQGTVVNVLLMYKGLFLDNKCLYLSSFGITD